MALVSSARSGVFSFNLLGLCPFAVCFRICYATLFSMKIIKTKQEEFWALILMHFLVLPSRAWFLSVCSLFVFSFVWSKLIIFGLLLRTLAISFGMDFRLRTIMMIMMTMIRSAHVFFKPHPNQGTNAYVLLQRRTRFLPKIPHKSQPACLQRPAGRGPVKWSG